MSGSTRVWKGAGKASGWREWLEIRLRGQPLPEWVALAGVCSVIDRRVIQCLSLQSRVEGPGPWVIASGRASSSPKA